MSSGFERMLRQFCTFVQPLIFVQIGLSRAFGQHLGHADQGFGIIGIELKHLAAHLHHLVGVVGALIGVHGRPVQQDPQFAVGKLGRKIVRRFLQGSGIGVGDRHFVGVKFGLGLGLRRTFPRRRLRERCARRGRCGLAAGLSCADTNVARASITTSIVARFMLSPWSKVEQMPS